MTVEGHAMGYDDIRGMGDGESRFLPTHWSWIDAAKTNNAIIGNLIRTYWRPVYRFLRRHGYGNEAAKDLTQGFFCDIVLEGGLVADAKRELGKFRTFLLTALQRYVASEMRRLMSKKARPKGGIASLDVDALENQPMPEAAETPEQAYQYQWAADLLGQVIAEVRKEYCGTGRTAHWEMFSRKILLPILEGTDSPKVAELCEELRTGQNEKQAGHLIMTVKRRFRTVLRRTVRKHVGSDAEVEEEVKEIFRILSRRAQICDSFDE